MQAWWARQPRPCWLLLQQLLLLRPAACVLLSVLLPGACCCLCTDAAELVLQLCYLLCLAPLAHS